MFLFLKSISDNEPHLYDYLTLSPPIYTYPPPIQFRKIDMTSGLVRSVGLLSTWLMVNIHIWLTQDMVNIHLCLDIFCTVSLPHLLSYFISAWYMTLLL